MKNIFNLKFAVVNSLISESYPKNSPRKNFFLTVCYLLDDDISIDVMNDEYPYGGLIGYGNSSMDCLLSWSKIFRLHAALHDAAGSVKTKSGKGPGYCYTLKNFPNSFLLGHVTGLAYCVYLKICKKRLFDALYV